MIRELNPAIALPILSINSIGSLAVKMQALLDRGCSGEGAIVSECDRCNLYLICLIYNRDTSLNKSMDSAKTIDTQIALPVELYQAIVRQAQAHRNSVSGEIVVLLTSILMQSLTDLTKEFDDWEAASDEGWLNLEASLASQKL
jgi:hypothetical protein